MTGARSGELQLQPQENRLSDFPFFCGFVLAQNSACAPRWAEAPRET